MNTAAHERAPNSGRPPTSVAAVLTTFNGRSRGYLDQAIRSILEQTSPPAEVIIVDDGSVDGTATWIKQKYPNLEVLTKPNGGPASARNCGANRTRSPRIAFLDDDDVWHPEKLQRQTARLDGVKAGNKVIGATICALRTIGPTGSPLGTISTAGSCYEWPAVLFGHQVFCPSASLVERGAFDATGGFREGKNLTYVEDFDFWARLARQYAIDADHQISVDYRRHPTQGSAHEKVIAERAAAVASELAATDDTLAPGIFAAHHYFRGALSALYRRHIPEAISLGEQLARSQHAPRIVALGLAEVAAARWPLQRRRITKTMARLSRR